MAPGALVSPVIRRLAVAVGVVFLLVHLRALPRTLEDIDSINFAMGVESFDVAAHRPHPPGYPIFIALTKASTRVIGWIAPSWDRDRRAAGGLAIWGVIAGALAAFVFTDFWMAIGLPPLLAWLAALIAVTSPLFWFTASRPLTDTPGLVAAVAVQAWLLHGWRALRSDSGRLPGLWWLGAAAAGFAIGLRSQTMWQTGPLLCWIVGEMVVRRRVRDAVTTMALAASGALLWAVPLVIVAGGLSSYLHALGSQGAQDFSGVEMLATTPTWRLFRASLDRTFIQPWEAAGLANVILGLAVIGLIRLAARGRGVLATLVLGFWPYLVFHLLFHETNTIRYGLPVIVPVAGLAVVGLATLGSYAAIIGAVAVSVTSLIVVQPRLMAYADGGAPVFRAFQEMQRALPGAAEPPLLRMHHQVWWGVKRVTEWYQRFWDVKLTPHPGEREWLAVGANILEHPTQPVWYLTDLSRNDVALFDPRGRSLGGRFQLDPDIRQLVGGSRLDGLAWWKIERPKWMLGRGWALTPEISGMTAADTAEPHRRPATAFLQRSPRAMRVMIGGRYLSGNGAALVSVEIEGRLVGQWTVTSSPIWFVQWIDLPDGVAAGPGAYAPMLVSVRPASGVGASPMIGLEQFDAADANEAIAAFGDGWQELEEDPRTGVSWRWTGDRSTLVVRGASRDLSLTVTGRSPLIDFDSAPTVVVRAGARELGRFRPSADFAQTVRVPIDALNEAAGEVTIETDRTFVPGERYGGPDRRHLGLRLYTVSLQ